MSLCPICNGFSIFQHQCPNCSANMSDTGRLSDYYGDYSPYREIDDLKMTNGDPDDLEHNQCLHVAFCTQCGYEEVIAVKEE